MQNLGRLRGPLHQISNRFGLCHRMASSNRQANKPRHKGNKPRSIPTHFLCIPLVNIASIPQLESSLEAFKAFTKSDHDELPANESSHPSHGKAKASLIPDGAHRPLGTIHLTLGVMNLADSERFKAATEFFQSLDLLKMMQEASSLAVPPPNAARPWHAKGSESEAENKTRQLAISVESLHALPKAKNATALYAEPFDPTGRFWAFCVLLRKQFIDAGFIEGGPNPPKPSPRPSNPSEIMKAAKEGDRPLLLHATLVNTIYVRGRPNRSAQQNPSKRPRKLEIDARNLLSHYQNYYTDETRTTPRATTVSMDSQPSEVSGGSATEQGKPLGSQDAFPYVWAEHIPIRSVCICKMGAKKLNPGQILPDCQDGAPSQDLSARLGQEYTVVSEKELSFNES